VGSRPSLFLHVPIHKTGSTALQQTLFCNEARLNTENITYLPDFTMDFQHSCLAATAGDALRGLLKQMRARSGGRSIILSTEQLHFLDDHPVADFIAALTEVFAGYDIKVVIYLRRQDEAFSSFYNQIVKFGTTTDNTGQAFSIYARFFDYERYLSLVRANLRKTDTMTVRIYDRNTLVGSDIVDDFLNAVGLMHCPIDKLPHMINPSLEKNVLKLKRAMNFHLDDAPIKLLQSLAGVLGDVSCQINNGNPDTNVLSVLERDLIMSSYAESNRRMVDQYLGGISFNSDIRPEPNYESSLDIVLPAVLARLARYFFHIVNEPRSAADGREEHNP